MGVLSPSEFGRAEWNPDVSVGSERDTLRSIALFLNTGTRVPPKGRVRCISEIVRSDEPKPRKEVPIWSLSDFAIEALVWNGRYDNGEAILEYGVRRRKDSVDFMLYLLASGRAPEIAPLTVLVWLDDDRGFEVIRLMAQSENLVTRKLGLNALIWMRSDRAAEALIAASELSDASVARAAIVSMSMFQSERLAHHLIALTYSDDATTRRCAILSLAGQKDGEVLARLAALIESSDKLTWLAALYAIGLQQSDQAMELLLSLTRSSNLNLVEYATEALGNFRDLRAIARLTELMSSDIEAVRMMAKSALWYARSDGSTPITARVVCR